jgi:hypothetical protein
MSAGKSAAPRNTRPSPLESRLQTLGEQCLCPSQVASALVEMMGVTRGLAMSAPRPVRPFDRVCLL